jgi:hypothetical protein
MLTHIRQAGNLGPLGTLNRLGSGPPDRTRARRVRRQPLASGVAPGSTLTPAVGPVADAAGRRDGCPGPRDRRRPSRRRRLMTELLAGSSRRTPRSAARRPARRSSARRCPSLGSKPVDVDGCRGAPGAPAASPFDWEVADKRKWSPRGRRPGFGGLSLILNGHIDVVSPEPARIGCAIRSRTRRGGCCTDAALPI